MKTASTTKIKKKTTSLNGAVVFYVNVGHLGSHMVEACVAKAQEDIKDFKEEVKKNGKQFIVIPVRDGQTRMEYLPLS